VLPGVSDTLSGGGLDQPVPFTIAFIASASWLVARDRRRGGAAPGRSATQAVVAGGHDVQQSP
jgi:hypothetical protein